MQMLA